MSGKNQEEQFTPYIRPNKSGLVPIARRKSDNEIVYYSRTYATWRTQGEIKESRNRGLNYSDSLHFDSIEELIENS